MKEKLQNLALMLAVGLGAAPGPARALPPADSHDVIVMSYAEASGLNGDSSVMDIMTYQGELLDQGVPVDGERAMELGFWTASSGGILVSAVLIPDVPIVGGRFAIPLYMGWEATAAEWLEVSVQNEAGDLETLGRQRLTAVPYARYSDVAREANLPWFRNNTDLSYFGRVGIGTSQPQGRLHIQGGPTDEVSLYGSGGVPMLHFRNTANVRDWVLRHDGTQFHLQRETAAGNESMTWEIDGDVGIGEVAPMARLDVRRDSGDEPVLRVRHTEAAANNAEGLAASVDGSGIGGGSAVAMSAIATSTTGKTIGVLARSNSSDGIGLFSQALSGSGLAVGLLSRSHASSGTAVWAIASSAGGSPWGVRSEVLSATAYAGHFSGGRNYFQGPVGLGTESPNARLHVAAPAASVPLRVQLDGATKLKADSNGGVAIGANATPPADGLFVQGPIQTSSTLRWLSISGRTFVNERSDAVAARSSSLDGLAAVGPAGAAVQFAAPVFLPHGAVVTELRALVTDLVAVTNVRVRLLRVDHADARSAVMAQVVSSDTAPGKQTLSNPGISLATIDNQNFAYEIRTDWTIPAAGNDSDIRLNSVRLAFEVTGPMP